MRLLRAILVATGLLAACSGAPPAGAVEAVNVRADASAIDLTAAVELQRTETDRILVSTAPGADGTVHSIEFRAREVIPTGPFSHLPIPARTRSTG